MSRGGGLRGACAAIVAVAALAVGAPAVAGERPSPHAFDPLELRGVERIEADARAGKRPRFTWPAVGGAAEYTVVVQNLRGRPYWAWRGPETAVFLGGVAEPPDESIGPVLRRPAQWQVIAYGPDGAIVGASPWRVVRPR